MSGSTAVFIAVPIVSVLALAFWLVMVFHADSHPTWRSGVLMLKGPDHCYHPTMNEEQRKYLLQIYTIERQDAGNGQIVVLATIAAALTYFVASVGFLVGRYADGVYKDVPSVILLASPLVTLALLSFLVVTTSTNTMRVKHLRELEDQLGLAVGSGIFPSAITDFGDIWEIRPRPRSWLRVYSALSLATYIPIFAIALGYIFVVLIPGPWPLYKGVVFAIYCLVIVIQVTGTLVALLHPRFKSEFIH